MRMWLVDPELMCRNHLLGEHLELHILAGCLNRGKNIRGFIEQGLVDPTLICKRHAELVTEMERRGYSHSSPLPELPARLEEDVCGLKKIWLNWATAAATAARL